MQNILLYFSDRLAGLIFERQITPEQSATDVNIYIGNSSL